MFLAIFVNRPIKPLGKIFRTKKQIKRLFFISELQELEVWICVQPNAPIIILILLNRFYKFAISMGPNTSDTCISESWIYLEYHQNYILAPGPLPTLTTAAVVAVMQQPLQRIILLTGLSDIVQFVQFVCHYIIGANLSFQAYSHIFPIFTKHPNLPLVPCEERKW